MKKIFLFTAVILSGIISLQLFTGSSNMKKDGAAPGYTGSPGDSGKNCTACHGGVPVPMDEWIRSNIPAEGYIPGNTYTVTAINKEAEATRFGFEVSPQNLVGDLLGKMIITDTVKTKFVGDDKYITYTANGVESIDSMAWSFDWVAPAKGTGAVTFYAAFNSNFNGHKENDQTYLSTITVNESGNSSSISTLKEEFKFNVYPNPTTEQLNISFNLTKKEQVQVAIYNIKGSLHSSLYNQELAEGKQTLKFNISDKLAPGVYLAKIKFGNQILTERIMVK